MKAILKVITMMVLFISGMCHAAEADNHLVRLAIVIAPAESGFIRFLTHDFQKQTGYQLQIISSTTPYQLAQTGKADAVISHFGKQELPAFVLNGYGSWPKMVFATQSVLIGPQSNPADVQSENSMSDAMYRIANTKQYFVDNELDEVSKLTELFWLQAGAPKKEGWFVHDNLKKDLAAELADVLDGYYIWGAYPFLAYKQQTHTSQSILVATDPHLQRIMSISLVNSDKIPGVNVQGAQALEDYLLQPSVQATIHKFRINGSTLQLFWAEATNN
ncbi:hypothetical protein [Parashewanella tropica]|uniref:hypothetical protein n=1 Tax=Parashewanella tropica TaxID=2547970 RepID=UPI00105A63F9|nr:hypothetical protein [Parashewanella tropica]